jgi:hypothetical protein
MSSILNLISEASEIKLQTVRTTPTSLSISWNIPTNYVSYNGAVILLSDEPFTNANNPTNGQTYTPSLNYLIPTNTISGANVVGAFYGALGDSITSTSLIVSNLDANKVYYASMFICDNVINYLIPGIKSYADFGVSENQSSELNSGNIPEATTPPLNPTLGQVFYNHLVNKVFMWNGSTWMDASPTPALTGTAFPTNPAQGIFFYNTISNSLFVYNGTDWIKANTAQEDVPLYNKLSIGTDGSIDERVRLISDVKAQLGWPKMCVELDESQFENAINQALREARRRLDSVYYHKHFLFGLKPDQNIYYLNNPEDDSNKIVNVIKIHRLSTFGLNVLSNDAGLYSQPFLNQLFLAGATMDLLSIHLVAQLGETFSLLFAQALQFEWRENTRELTILRKLYKNEPVVLECVMEKTEQDILKDRWTSQWIFDWTLAVCYEQLSNIRGKFQSLPGPNGITLNGSELAQKAETMKIELLRQVNDYEVGSNIEFGNSFILFG